MNYSLRSSLNQVKVLIDKFKVPSMLHFAFFMLYFAFIVILNLQPLKMLFISNNICCHAIERIEKNY
jgi:hypothetical protein